MASLESFATAGVTATRNAGSQEITITGGLLQVTGYLTPNTVPPGYRIRCSSGGGLAFNTPNATAETFSIETRNGSTILLSSATTGLIDGDAVEKDGDLGDLDNATVYYVEKGSANTIYLHATRAAALAGLTATRISAGSGAVPNADGGIELSGGRRDIGILGDLDGAQITILEEDDAFAFRGDNFNSAQNVSRFQAGKITLRNLYYESLRPNGGSRSDFDIASGAEPIFEDCIISTLAQYNHFASSLIRIDGLTFRNNTAGANSSALEFSAAFATPPRGLTIEPSGRAVVILASFLTAGTPARFDDLAGISQLAIYPDSGLSDSATDSRIVWLADPAGNPGKPTSGRAVQRGQLEIRRSVTLDFGPEASATAGTCRLIPKSEDTPYTADIVSAAATGPHAFDAVLAKRSAGGESGFTDFNSYRYLKVSPHYRKASGDFTVASQASAGATQTVTGSLTRETYPNGSHFALSASAPSSVADLDDLYEAIKRHEIANPKDGGEQTSLAVINADGYIELAEGFNLDFSASATELTAWEASTETLTVKASAAIAASANGLLGVQVSGDGAVTSTGTVDLTAFLSKTATAQNSILEASAAEAGIFLGLYGAAGALIASATTATGSLSRTFTATAAQSAAGCRLIAAKAGFEPQVRELDLSAGGSRSETFGPLAQIQQFDGSASYDSANASSVSRATFNVSNLSDVKATLEVANESLSALEFFATFARDAHGTAAGRKYLAFGGVQPTALALFSGDLISLPASVRIKRRASGNTSATVAASVIAADGATILDESNGSVQLTGGISLSDFQQAIFANFDLDPAQAGTQSLAAKLLSLGTVATQNAAAIAALPSAAENATQILGSATAIGGDTVKQALARNRSLAADILGAEVAAGGDTAKQALARIAGLPDADGVKTALLAAGISGSTPLSKVLEVLFAVLAGTATRTGDSTAFAIGGATIISATTDDSGNRTEVSIP